MDKWLSHPTAIKIVSLALGILLWAVVHFDSESTPNNVASLYETKTFSDVKVQAKGLNERNYVLADIQPKKVKLMVSGTHTDLSLARPEEYVVRVDLSTVTAGTHTLPLQTDLPRGIKTLQITPSTVTVTVVELQTKEFEVQVTPQGSPKVGYKAGTPVLRPTNRVHVTLPSGDIEKVDHVGAPISIEGADATLKNKSVKLIAYDVKGRVIEGADIDPAVLEVEVPITNPFKTVPLQFKLIGHMPDGLSIGGFEPDMEQVTIYGPQKELDKIDFIEADVDLASLTKSGKVKIPLVLPKTLTEISPREITLSVQIVLTQTRSIQGLPVTIKGLGEGLTMKITDPVTGRVDITFKGAPSMLDKLQPGDVSIEADLSGRGPGVYTIPLNVNSPRFVDQSGGNNAVIVEITSIAPPASSSPSIGSQEPDTPASTSPEPSSTPGHDSGGQSLP